MELHDILFRLCDIDRKAQALISETGFDAGYGLGSQVRPNPDDPDDRFLRDAVENLLIPFEDLHEDLLYLKKPTHGEYQLQRFSNGRYGYVDVDGIEKTFTCGSPVEAKVTDEHGLPFWVSTRFEHDGDDYFLWRHRSVPLEGLNVRERW